MTTYRVSPENQSRCSKNLALLSREPPKISMRPATEPNTNALPRILCLHGGGVNASIFEVQSRALVQHLESSFRLVWADAPFFCDPHPDVIEVYKSYAPFRRWLRWLPEHAELDNNSCIEEIGYALRTTMEEDDEKGANGEWVGLMGFSQGAKVCASMLLEQQAREAKLRTDGDRAVALGFTEIPNLHWRFGILLAGSAPLINLNPKVLRSPALVGAGELCLEEFWLGMEVDQGAIIRSPTLHVHGLADPGLYRHQKLLNEYCSQDSTALVEWEGAHRVPLKSSDVIRVVCAIYDTAERTGIRVNRTV